MPQPIPALHAIVPAGGAGTRLWPLSRADRPKFLLDLDGSGRSLLQQTYDRLAPLVDGDGLTVVTGRRHGDAVAAQLPALAPERIVLEPSGRDSMPAIALGAAIALRADAEAVVASFAADHLIADVDAFGDVVRQAAEVARAGHVTTIGLEPTEPSTAFGYVEAGDALDVPGAPDAVAARRFVEKPDAETAREYVAAGRFRWNAGMFVVRADVLLGHLQRLQPALHAGALAIADARGTAGEAQAWERWWPTMTKIAIDHAIAEPVAAEGGVAMVPASFGWTDVGDVAALAEVLGPDATLRTLGGADVLAIDSTGLVVADGERTVTVLGVDDVAVVDTPDALLVTRLEHAQRVKDVVARWRSEGRDDLL
ncbi:mannose-1-phosphate guanylyltransferase [Mumia flava]|uniref:Mannose-1-phosphate guanylyltransferase n=1 Tax=Mumia flava TaxID=1348852 RepID=A0A0B2BVL5_9ACTN|nr:sugar phosphate nucleotidyltransferase [Mumia flava]PJJ58125.1 mannose-1-phosphate guanylyltransferase [Mumia flava]